VEGVEAAAVGVGVAVPRMRFDRGLYVVAEAEEVEELLLTGA
jgi:hypothetical protein